MKKEMLINVLQAEECRIAILENGALEELYVERTSQESYVGNIYKGRIVNIEPSIQAAFVDFGIGRNGFLHVSDVDPAYYRHLEQPRDGRGRGRDDRRGGRRNDRDRPPKDYDFPEAEPAHPPAAETFEEVGGFGAGLLGALPPISILPEVPTELPPQHHVEHRPPAEPTEPVEVIEEATEFGAGIFEEPPPESPAPTAEDEDATKEKRRGRTSRGGGRSRTNKGTTEEAAEAKGRRKRPAARKRLAEGEEAPPEEKPRPMESAERRTDPHDPELGSLEGPAGGGPLEEASAPVEGEAGLNVLPEFSFDEPLADEPGLDNNFAEQTAGPGAPSGAGLYEADEFGLDEGPPPARRRDRDRDRGGRGGPRKRGDRDDHRGGPRRLGRDGTGRPKPLIQDIFKRGQEVLVQVIKEGIGTKGPTLSTYISIAGRYLVLMPGLNRIGVSRKIEDEEARARLKEILRDLQPPKGLGFIIRTAGMDRNKNELQNDLNYLLRLWQVVVGRIKRARGPGEIYKESDLITRTIRDIFTADIDTIWVDEPEAYAHAKEFLEMAMPRYADRIKLYEGTEPLFYKYRVEEEIARIHQKKLPLSMGGSIVIESTEALVAIDVNSGSFRASDNNAEETAYQMNLQAAKEIARQLRLRDLGGVIVNDFIDMREEKHRRGVEKAMRDALARDRARTKILRISPFGIIEMTRQRIRPALKKSIFQDCPHCHGTGHVKSAESMSLEVMRMLQLAGHRENISRIEVRVASEVAIYLLNRKRREIAALEDSGEMQIAVLGQHAVAPETLSFTCYDNNGNEVRFVMPDALNGPRGLPPRERGGRDRNHH